VKHRRPHLGAVRDGSATAVPQFGPTDNRWSFFSPPSTDVGFSPVRLQRERLSATALPALSRDGLTDQPDCRGCACGRPARDRSVEPRAGRDNVFATVVSHIATLRCLVARDTMAFPSPSCPRRL
jgi:hypothetical protein